MLHIPDDLKLAYQNGDLPSHAIAKLLNVHPVTIRRQLRRNNKSSTLAKVDLIRIRNEFRASKAHLPAKELTTLLNVSYATAVRIRKKYGKLDPNPEQFNSVSPPES